MLEASKVPGAQQHQVLPGGVKHVLLLDSAHLGLGNTQALKQLWMLQRQLNNLNKSISYPNQQHSTQVCMKTTDRGRGRTMSAAATALSQQGHCTTARKYIVIIGLARSR
jgi:hypothetical protein